MTLVTLSDLAKYAMTAELLVMKRLLLVSVDAISSREAELRYSTHRRRGWSVCVQPTDSIGIRVAVRLFTRTRRDICRSFRSITLFTRRAPHTTAHKKVS